MKAAPTYFEWAEGKPQIDLRLRDTVDASPGEIEDTGVEVVHVLDEATRALFGLPPP